MVRDKAYGHLYATEKQGGGEFSEADEQVALIRMCDDCRVKAQFEAKDNPMALGERRRPRTSEDYLRERAARDATKPGEA